MNRRNEQHACDLISQPHEQSAGPRVRNMRAGSVCLRVLTRTCPKLHPTKGCSRRRVRFAWAARTASSRMESVAKARTRTEEASSVGRAMCARSVGASSAPIRSGAAPYRLHRNTSSSWRSTLLHTEKDKGKRRVTCTSMSQRPTSSISCLPSCSAFSRAHIAHVREVGGTDVSGRSNHCHVCRCSMSCSSARRDGLPATRTDDTSTHIVCHRYALFTKSEMSGRRKKKGNQTKGRPDEAKDHNTHR